MALIRWEPAAELNTIQNEMNRLFNTFFDQPGQTGRGNGTMRRWLPPMDLVETTDRLPLWAVRLGVAVGVVLARQAPVGAADLGRAGVVADTEHPVVVVLLACHHHRRPDRSRAARRALPGGGPCIWSTSDSDVSRVQFG
jgi:hypothetical protein